MGTRDTGTFWNMNGKGMVLAPALSSGSPAFVIEGVPRAHKSDNPNEKSAAGGRCAFQNASCVRSPRRERAATDRVKGECDTFTTLVASERPAQQF